MIIELSLQEARQLIGLLDLAIKSGGLQVAQAALPLALKMQLEIDKNTDGLSSDVPSTPK
tara:strand:+ start:590 stop:769 length:180 start_codon:yes stop_codon:yes gene_type:complete